MIKYLVILLDDTSVSYCHYNNNKTERNLISLDDLKEGIFFAMKENLSIQFVYPEYEIPEAYKVVIETIDHSKVKPYAKGKRADVFIIDGMDKWESVDWLCDTVYVLRVSKRELFARYNDVFPILNKITRLNVVITDVDSFSDIDFENYRQILSKLNTAVMNAYIAGNNVQLNILTDRMMLDEMNNCNAGVENITLAPDGRFYVCPAFYHADDGDDFGIGKAKVCVGDLQSGIDIKNPQLYKLQYAPICKKCDAYQCKRCVWLNRKTTYEVNTPSHEQCVIAHLERNAGRELLHSIREYGMFMPEKEIKEIDYLDPFDIVKN